MDDKRELLDDLAQKPEAIEARWQVKQVAPPQSAEPDLRCSVGFVSEASPAPTPDRCPTCHSGDRKLLLDACKHYGTLNSWHFTEPSVPAPSEPSLIEAGKKLNRVVTLLLMGWQSQIVHSESLKAQDEWETAERRASGEQGAAVRPSSGATEPRSIKLSRSYLRHLLKHGVKSITIKGTVEVEDGDATTEPTIPSSGATEAGAAMTALQFWKSSMKYTDNMRLGEACEFAEEYCAQATESLRRELETARNVNQGLLKLMKDAEETDKAIRERAEKAEAELATAKRETSLAYRMRNEALKLVAAASDEEWKREAARAELARLKDKR